MQHTGTPPYEFIQRSDLHALPGSVLDHETRLHGGFAADRRAGFGQVYYGMPGCGILRVDPDLRRQELIPLPEDLKPMNFHSTKIGNIDGSWRLFLPANENGLVAVLTLDGKLDFILTRPEFEQYQAPAASYAPTDTALVDRRLFIADGYGSNFISVADASYRTWLAIFGGKTEDAHENGRFATAHGITAHYADPGRLLIADRPSGRIQEHTLDGSFVASHALPPGSWPCGIDYFEWQGRRLAVIGSLNDPVQDRPAPVYIVDAASYQVLASLRPKEDLGIGPAQHIHNVVGHVHDGRLFLVCQSWNPGHYFVLEGI